MSLKNLCVAIVLHDQGYGGPEEGGWWYDTYEPQEEYAHLVRGFTTRTDAKEYADILRKEYCEKLNIGRRPYWSAAGEGTYEAYIFEGLPCRLPLSRPFYE